MPELPEVETVVRHLYDRFAHAVIDHVYVRLPKMIQTPIDAFSSLLQGGKIESIVRRGKYILIHFNNGYTLVSHLRMEGKYVERSHQDAPLSPHAHLSFYLQDGRRLDYEDVRTFGTFGLYQTHEVMQSPSLNKLGPEPLSLDDASWLYSRFQTVKKSIKATLLDQTIIAGIGNIYADEILFATEIHPLTRAHQLTLQQCEHMLVNMKRILTQAIHDGGTRIRSYQSGQAIDGQFILNIHAYGQEGKPCVRCHHRIHKITVVGRGTHFCPTCQHDPHLPYIIGVTGSIAAGKSTLLNLANEHGFHTLKADDIVKKLYTNKTILKRIQQNFDPTFVDNHHLNSQALLEYLTQSTAHRQRYEKWLHPLVKQAITSQLKKLKVPLVFVEIPLLFQSHSDIFCDEVIAVDAPEESRLRWLLHRNGERAHLLWLLAETNDWYTYKDHIDHVLFNDQTYAEWSLTCQQVIMDYKLAAEGK